MLSLLSITSLFIVLIARMMKIHCVSGDMVIACATDLLPLVVKSGFDSYHRREWHSSFHSSHFSFVMQTLSWPSSWYNLVSRAYCPSFCALHKVTPGPAWSADIFVLLFLFRVSWGRMFARGCRLHWFISYSSSLNNAKIRRSSCTYRRWDWQIIDTPSVKHNISDKLY